VRVGRTFPTASNFQSLPARNFAGLYDLDFHSEALLRQVLAMWYPSFFRTVFERLQGLDFHQVSLMVLAIVAFGFYCLRGFGSRSDY
jgi:hypothetical protein